MSFNAVILAAGEGKRMKSNKPKVLHQVCGKALVEWVLKATNEAGAANNIVVVGHKAEAIKEYLGDKAKYALQTEQLGTGHAVMQAVNMLDKNMPTLVTCGDMPLITSATLKAAYDYHVNSNNALTVLTAALSNPAGYGRVIRDDNGVAQIVEDKDADADQKQVCEINSGTYFFDTGLLIESLSHLDNNNAQNEYYLTDTVKQMIGMGKKVDAFIVENPDEIVGINDRRQLAEASDIKRYAIIDRHLSNGVTFIDQYSTYIDEEVEIGIDTIIYPQTSIEGNSKIGENCIISGSKIVSTTIGNNTDVTNSVLTESEVGDNTHVGPFAYLRPHSKIGNNVKIGDFVEIKNSSIDDGTKVSHLTYVGDADVGKKVNFGCGTILVNYDGKSKFRSTIHDNVFIGCNTNLISPVTINESAFIAAGSTITDDVPQNALAIARTRQVVKEDWRTKRK